MLEAEAKVALNGLGSDVSSFKRKGVASTRRGGRLANAVLAYLPIGVAVVDSGQRLLFWNEQAASLFGIAPQAAADTPPLTKILAGIVNLTPRQRDAIVSFGATHIAAGDKAEPDSCLRISLGRDRPITIQMRGIGAGRWMLVIDDGKLTALPARKGPAQDNAVAWLDPLTGLSNRRHFNQILRDLVDNAAPGSKHTMLMINLDRFKPINDTLGHSIGDALLSLVAQRLRRETREEDLLVRLGGDEFVILIANSERAEPLATRVIEILSRPFLVEGHIANISASIGIARFPEHAGTSDDLMRYAQLALYQAKSGGKRTWRIFEPDMAVQVNARRDLEADLRKALTLGELSLAYQAQFNLAQQALTGFEALLRWNHPTHGAVSPALFIPVAEDIGCIAVLGEWVLKTACKEAVRWPSPLTVAVNVSPRQLEDADRLFTTVQAVLQTSGLAPERLELEITESSLLAADDRKILETLHRLRGLGIRIAMDDFGTGYSSLSQLRLFPFSKIKIDQSFVAGLGVDEGSAAMIRAIAGLGAGLGMTTIAEGVETAEQAAMIEADGCINIQGYLISRPIAASEIDSLIRRHIPAPDDPSTTG